MGLITSFESLSSETEFFMAVQVSFDSFFFIPGGEMAEMAWSTRRCTSSTPSCSSPRESIIFTAFHVALTRSEGGGRRARALFIVEETT